MNVENVRKWIADGDIGAVEDAWMESMEGDGDAAGHLHEALEALVSADRAETAQTLAWMAISDRQDADGPADALELAKTLLPALAGNDELRLTTADLFRRVHGRQENFDDFLRTSGLLDNQSLRRAIRTLTTALAATDGTFMVNRFDYRVIRMERYNATMGYFEAAAAGGAQEEYEPKLLADEFVPVDEDDFRVLCQFRTDQMGRLLSKAPARLLTGICMARGGKIDATSLKDALVPRYVEKEKWSSWWNSARAAARKSDFLSITGRSPAVIQYHPNGRPLEQDFAGAVAKARTPLAVFKVLQDYARQLKGRRRQADDDFLLPILAGLAGQAISFSARRPIDALAACLAIEAAERMSLPVPAERPTVDDMLAGLDDPAAAIARIEEPALWPVAFDAVARRSDAAVQFERLLCLMPAGQLDEVAGRLRAAGGDEAIPRVLERSANEPLKYLQVCLWLWRGKAKLADSPPLLDILSRLLVLMRELHRDADADRNLRRETFQQIRAALSANDFRSFRAAVKQMDRDVAETFKRRIERSEGLSPTCRDGLLGVLREAFFDLFLKARVEPWMDDTVLWTTEKALARQEAAYKELMEVTIPANSKAVGAAAALGDLSENSEWQYAVEEQRRLQARASKMRDDLTLARILHEGDAPNDSVGIGSLVGLKRVADGRTLTIAILGPWDTDVQNGVVSYKTPLAQALCGKTIGNTTSIKIEGAEGDYVIDTIASAL